MSAVQGNARIRAAINCLVIVEQEDCHRNYGLVLTGYGLGCFGGVKVLNDSERRLLLGFHCYKSRG
jgi:hypothetical protein